MAIVSSAFWLVGRDRARRCCPTLVKQGDRRHRGRRHAVPRRLFAIGIAAGSLLAAKLSRSSAASCSRSPRSAPFVTGLVGHRPRDGRPRTPRSLGPGRQLAAAFLRPRLDGRPRRWLDMILPRGRRRPVRGADRSPFCRPGSRRRPSAPASSPPPTICCTPPSWSPAAVFARSRCRPSGLSDPDAGSFWSAAPSASIGAVWLGPEQIPARKASAISARCCSARCSGSRCAAWKT
jgi:hypothetical protein